MPIVARGGWIPETRKETMEEIKYIITCDLCGKQSEAWYSDSWRTQVPVMVTDDRPEGCGAKHVEVIRRDLCPQCRERVAVLAITIDHDGEWGPLTCSI